MASDPDLKPCPFCGKPARIAEFGHHTDPYTGKHAPDIRVGCPSAFTTGSDPARCPVAPIICQLTNPTIDIVAAWNRRAGTTGARREEQAPVESKPVRRAPRCVDCAYVEIVNCHGFCRVNRHRRVTNRIMYNTKGLWDCKNFKAKTEGGSRASA